MRSCWTSTPSPVHPWRHRREHRHLLRVPGPRSVGISLATLGVLVPPMIIVTIISAFFWSFAENPWVQHALTGVRACVCALIINSTIRLYRKAVLDLPTFLVFLTVLILAAFVGLSPAILVVGAGLFGLAYHRIRKERPL